MILNDITEVTFLEYTHSYLFEDSQLLGVTSLMKKHGLSANYDGISSGVLKNAADLGKQAHKVIEDYINGQPTVAGQKLVESFKRLNLNIVHTEYLVSDLQTVASSIDLLNCTDDGVFQIIDMKRTSTVHRNALAWQLGIYKFLFLLRNPNAVVSGCYCLPIKKGNTENINDDVCGELIEITPVPAEKVKALLECERDGVLYCDCQDKSADGIVSAEDFAILASRLNAIAELSAMVKEAESEIEGIRNGIYERMLEADKDEIEIGDTIIKLKRPYIREGFDSAGFKKKHPDLYEQFKKRTEIKGNINITSK